METAAVPFGSIEKTIDVLEETFSKWKTSFSHHSNADKRRLVPKNKMLVCFPCAPLKTHTHTRKIYDIALKFEALISSTRNEKNGNSS